MIVTRVTPDGHGAPARRADRRGADDDPARRHRRLDDDAHAGPRLRAGRRLLLHRGSARRRAGDRRALLRQRPGVGQRVQRRHRRDRRARAGARRRASARRRRAAAGAAATRSTPCSRGSRRSRRTTRSPPDVLAARPRPRARRPGPVRLDRRRARRRRVRRAPARCCSPARTSAGTTPSTRSSGRCCSTARSRPPGCGLFVSGRASVEMVQKAWAAGFGTLVAVSAPTALAVHAARRAGLTLVGFVRDDGFNVYSPRSLDAMRTETGLGVLHLFCKPPATVDREAVGAVAEGGRGRRRPGRHGGDARPQVRRRGDGAAPRLERAARAAARRAGGRPRRRRQLRQHHRGQRVRQGHARAHAPRAAVPDAAAGGQAGVLLLPDDEAARGPRQLVRHAVRASATR